MKSSADGEERAGAARDRHVHLPALDGVRPSTRARTLCARREVPLTPRHAAGVVAAVEQEAAAASGSSCTTPGASRSTTTRTARRAGRTSCSACSASGIRDAAGTARVFVNLENLTNVRQTRYDPLVLPARGHGGRWTTDAWTELAGFTVNGGVRFAF